MENMMSEDFAPRQLVPAQLEGETLEFPGDDVATIGSAAPTGTPEGLEAVFDVPVKVQAVLGRSRMEIGELMRLKPGDVVELDRRVGEPVDIYVNNRLIARGEVVLIDNALGVTLTEIVRQDR
ncbi:flagellar motor switch protein FliN [Sphingosinicella sp. BN140058]|uniref:flagellar motor switch protein FliN n=1 Tax=Sphingosinicella sp. BN140058 TaxID=1892855 RepID=UPI00352AA4F1